MSDPKIKVLEHTLRLVRAELLQADPRMLSTDLLQLALICNGCGAANAKIDLIPDHIYGVYVGYACMIHDFDYHIGKTEADRKFADDRLKANLLYLISNGSVILWPARRLRVNTYYKSVRLAGEAPFWSGKEFNVVTLR